MPRSGTIYQAICGVTLGGGLLSTRTECPATSLIEPVSETGSFKVTK